MGESRSYVSPALVAYYVPETLAAAWSKGYLTDLALRELGQPIGGPVLFIEEIAGRLGWRMVMERVSRDCPAQLIFRAHARPVDKMARRWGATPTHQDPAGWRFRADGDTLKRWVNHARRLDGRAAPDPALAIFGVAPA